MKEITISSDLLRSIYKDANDELKAKLEAEIREKDLRPQDVMERIKTFQDACDELGKDDQLVRDYERFKQSGIEDKHLGAYLQLCIITKALNEGWEWSLGEYGHHPYLYKVSHDYKCGKGERLWLSGGGSYNGSNYGFACEASSYAWSSSYAYISARLVSKTKELALYSFSQFYQLWGWYLLDCEITPHNKQRNGNML